MDMVKKLILMSIQYNLNYLWTLHFLEPQLSLKILPYVVANSLPPMKFHHLVQGHHLHAYAQTLIQGEPEQAPNIYSKFAVPMYVP